MIMCDYEYQHRYEVTFGPVLMSCTTLLNCQQNVWLKFL